MSIFKEGFMDIDMEIIMKKLLILILVISSSCYSNTQICKDWHSKIILSKENAQAFSFEPIDLDKTFSKVEHDSLLENLSIIKIDNGESIPVFSNKEIIFIDEINGSGVNIRFENDELKLYGSRINIKELNYFSNDFESRIPQDLKALEGYVDFIKTTSDYELYDLMFTTKFSDFDCDSDNWIPMIYVMNSKIINSLKSSKWYKVVQNDRKILINFNSKSNSIEMKYYTKNELIDLNFIYKQPIDEKEFKKWLYTISQDKA